MANFPAASEIVREPVAPEESTIVTTAPGNPIERVLSSTVPRSTRCADDRWGATAKASRARHWKARRIRSGTKSTNTIYEGGLRGRDAVHEDSMRFRSIGAPRT